ncbi:serine hydrolase domain-containing protein [Paraburkholderia sp. BCC1885]|uniref:serine hydrolase domain-containing protein n=1 Tax=Paraburkholderia sp. BCC1885 TaxID=2562669 RepID=UPI0016435878|nr:serine hydrolase domain-containing protein [Paraburkholderia sp. BCC1885]
MLEFLRNHAVLPSSSPMTLDDCADWLASFARLTQGLVLREIKPVDVTHLTQTALVDDRLYCAAHRMHLRFDALAGSKIIEIDFGPGEMRSVAMSKADGLAQIRSYCDQGALTDVFSGTVLVARGSDVLFEYACGAANKRYDVPNNLDTRFNLGSANKMFTAVAIAQLVERGRLSFTDSIDRYIDDSWLPASVTSGITVHHLLSHTSGLGSYFNETFFNGSRARFRAIDDFKPLVRDDRPAFTPGERFEYSNTGMLLAGVIIERVSGKSYYDYIREAIYAPCLMQDTDCYDIDAPVPNLAMGYIPLMDAMTGQTKPRTATGWRENIFEHVAKGGPAGGGYSTVRDLHRFATALVAGELVGPAMREALWTDYTGSGYGYGFEVGRTATKTTIGHGGGFAGISASFEVTLETGRIAIVLSNYEAGTFGLARCIGHTLDQMEP